MIEQGRLVFAGTVEEFDNYIIPNMIEVSLIARPPVEELLTIPGVNRAEEIGGLKYRLYCQDAQETLERVADVAAERKWRLNGLTLIKSSLDEIFAELSKK